MYRRVRALALVMVVAGACAQAATLQSAHAAIQILHDGTCEVRMRFVMASDAPVTSEHRLLVSDSAVVDDVIVSGAPTGDARRAGRSLLVPVSIQAGEVQYDARYRIEQEPGSGWCGLIVPDVPTAGVARTVQIDAALPADVRRVPGEFPAMAWEEGRGSVRLGHVPAFVTVPHAPASEEVSWHRSFDLRTALDTTAVAILLVASAIWVASRRRRR